LKFGGAEVHDLEVEIFNYDPSLAPAGKAVIKMTAASSYAYWKNISNDRARYDAEKQCAANRFIELLLERIPELTGKIEVVDVATPLTFERYTGNFQGMQVWWPKKGTLRMLVKGLSRTLPGLKNFYMTGQWADGMIGISSVAVSGRNLIKRLCKEDARQFTTRYGAAGHVPQTRLLRNTH
jgi:phytoene dehydrogenase-like protein